VSDVLQHYLGCIATAERPRFLKVEHSFWRERERGEVLRLESKNRDSYSHDVADEARDRIRMAIEELAIAIDELQTRLSQRSNVLE